MGEPKEFAKTLSTELLIADNSGMNVITHLDKAYMDSTEMILNTRVSNFLEYQRLPTMSVATYVAGFYARLDNLCQLQIPDELKGHLLLKQANLEKSERTMIVASAKGNYKITAIVDSMRQFFGNHQDSPIAGPSFHTKDSAKPEKRFCNFCKKKNHLEKDCWKKRKSLRDSSEEAIEKTNSRANGSIYVSFLSTEKEIARTQGLLIQVQFIRL
jgi:hypothetical protein